MFSQSHVCHSMAFSTSEFGAEGSWFGWSQENLDVS